ncbi:TonB-dependent siderophore receptor [Pseudomonas sp. Marseille-Q5115]|uniref:TonB-dependent siderophore receptor n=1 Tax=Pseudomonas sp. Marseille-Q5115 TaxID=2866593 RepID=UPI001CE4493A|nr:TonB-dependent siderophore receptor [Pseudomonas sp. Marseille-Q5115]
MYPAFKPRHLSLALLAMTAPLQAAEDTEKRDGTVLSAPAPVELEATLVTAEQELRQAPGVSIITSEDLKKRPPVNDISDLVRRMPGVNLTGNSASGQYGNNRQIDLRGMGPENTLILIDGKPVTSRNSVRMGRSGERNTRGDSNWVPVEAIERIEVLRGPAAARYGSGAAGGVVNIITKAPTAKHSGSVTTYFNQPEHSDEGATKRIGFNAAGPLADQFSYRVYGNFNKTDADDLALNQNYAASATSTPPAGREGVRNKDIDGLLRWDLDPRQTLELEAGYSRQGNIYAGDRAVNGSGSALLTELANSGAETNVMYRQTGSVTHRGDWDFGTSQVVASFENTRNRRLNEGLAGGPEGSIGNASSRSTSELNHYRFAGELNIPVEWGFTQVVTLGTEATRDKLDDPYSNSQALNGGAIPGISANRSGESDAHNYALFMEDNIELSSGWTLTPGVRFDRQSDFGGNWSPSLNSAYKLTDTVTLKAGIARAFKAPNLYQSNPNYLYYTRGTGCPVTAPNLGSGCYVLGNDHLDAETSVNKEVGVAFADNGWVAGLTYFHNDYKNKIVAGMDEIAQTSIRGRVFQWENAPKAVVAGWEGNLTVPLLGNAGDVLSWTTNVTYMIENHNKVTNEPLSVIPEYTINSMLDWAATENLDLSLNMTHYGEQEPRSLTGTGANAAGAALEKRGAYTLFGTTANYRLSKTWSVTAGVNNLFDKRLFREDNSGNAGAATYNEPGRAYFASVTAEF